MAQLGIFVNLINVTNGTTWSTGFINDTAWVGMALIKAYSFGTARAWMNATVFINTSRG